MEKTKLLYLNLPRYFIHTNSSAIYATTSADFLLLIENYSWLVKEVIAG